MRWDILVVVVVRENVCVACLWRRIPPVNDAARDTRNEEGKSRGTTTDMGMTPRRAAGREAFSVCVLLCVHFVCVRIFGHRRVGACNEAVARPQCRLFLRCVLATRAREVGAVAQRRPA